MYFQRKTADYFRSNFSSIQSLILRFGYLWILLFKCAQFREQGKFIDVRLKVGEDLFPAHRIVLAANSDYFHAMFAHGMKESNEEVIELKDENILAEAFKIVMDSIYRGEIFMSTMKTCLKFSLQLITFKSQVL